MSTKRMTANPVKAPRHRPGKITVEEGSSSEDESAGEDNVQKTTIAPPPKVPSAGRISRNLKKIDLDERRRKAAAEEVARLGAEKALRAKEEEGFVTEESEDEESEGGSDEESGSEEETSEEEAPRRVMLRPTFIKKDKRNAAITTKADTRTKEAISQEDEVRRRAAADAIVEDQIQKDLAAKAAGKKNWDDEEEDVDDVDDTDGLEPEAEHAAWKLRELKRIKRDREAIEAREAELAEIERRRNLTEGERKAEDEEYISRQKEEKESKGKMGFMQKYYHKGAFFQDDLKAEGLDSRDIMGSRFADDVQNRELLPQALQMRDMTKLGKKGASKYRDLKTEDTGNWGQFDHKRPGKGFAGAYGADERFAPDRDRPGASGANSMPISNRKEKGQGVVGAPEEPKSFREGSDLRTNSRADDNYRPSDRRSRSRSRSRSPRRRHYQRNRSRSRSPRWRDERQRPSPRPRSRSPRRRPDDDDDRNRRKRSSSRDTRNREGDKRRRLDSK